jgi:D-serine deaminase-like pyridoxal phosphate-dependent protein
MAIEKALYPFLDTPAVLVDLDKLEANIRRMTKLASEAGLKLRPHTKVHESAMICKWQIERGAHGIEVGPIAQAAAMVEEGINDVLIAHPFYGEHKMKILKRILDRDGVKITVVLDMIEQADSISRVGQAAGRKVPVVIKIDTNLEAGGLQRFGVIPGDSTFTFAERLSGLPGVELVGIYAHELGLDQTEKGRDRTAYKTAEIMARTARELRNAGFNIEHVSVGATPTFHSTCRYIKEGKFPEITEIHPGHFVIGDIWYVSGGGETVGNCAVTVLTATVSTSHNEWAIIDAGYKTLGRDPLIGNQNKPGFSWNGMARMGVVKGRTDLFLGVLAAESGFLYYKDQEKRVVLGERIEVIPNNVTEVINIHEQMYGVRNGKLEVVIPVTGRGRGN